MAQTILDSDVFALPDSFSPEFRHFLTQCLNRDPELRLPAEALLGAPWLIRNGATSNEAAVDVVQSWIRQLNHK